MDRLTVRRVLRYGLAGVIAGLLCDLVWSSAADADHHCYTYGLRLLADPSNDEGWCYSFGTRATREAFIAVAFSVVLTGAGVWVATRRFAARDRRFATQTSAAVALVAMIEVVMLLPFEYRFIPLTPPAWLPVAVLTAAYVLGALAAGGSTRRIAALTAAGLVVVMSVLVVPAGKAWQHRQDRASLGKMRLDLLAPRLPHWHVDQVTFEPLSPTSGLNIRLVPDGQESGPGSGPPATAQANPDPQSPTDPGQSSPAPAGTSSSWIAVHLAYDVTPAPNPVGKPTTRCVSLNNTCWPEVDVRARSTSVTLSAVGSRTGLDTLLLAADALHSYAPAELARHVCAC